MVSIRINGDESNFTTSDSAKFAELIELIKASIDPDHIITGLLLDGKELSEEDWTSTVGRLSTAILEVETGTPEEYVRARMEKTSDVVRECFMEFRDARKSFQEGRMLQGNQKLARAVTTLRSFFEWYGTLLELSTEERRKELDISTHVTAISEICKRICQQQLYQSWWALGETISKELEPKLDDLEDYLRKHRTQLQ